MRLIPLRDSTPLLFILVIAVLVLSDNLAFALTDPRLVKPSSIVATTLVVLIEGPVALTSFTFTLITAEFSLPVLSLTAFTVNV